MSLDRTPRFVAEMETALNVKKEAESRGLNLSLEEAHRVWADHSYDYCAQWLEFRDDDPTAEILCAINKWKKRRGPKCVSLRKNHRYRGGEKCVLCGAIKNLCPPLRTIHS